MNIRQQFKSTPYGSLIWRVFIGVVGGLITVVGTIFLFAPGPGMLVLLAGLGILATEFAWASRAILKTKSLAASAAEKVGIPLWAKYLIAAVCTLISLILIGYHFA
ncbi:MAG: PGPGW domain-containing protein [Actinomycetota bacterium]